MSWTWSSEDEHSIEFVGGVMAEALSERDSPFIFIEVDSTFSGKLLELSADRTSSCSELSPLLRAAWDQSCYHKLEISISSSITKSTVVPYHRNTCTKKLGQLKAHRWSN